MTKEQYENQKQQIIKDKHYSAVLKKWMLEQLEKAYEGSNERLYHG